MKIESKMESTVIQIFYKIITNMWEAFFLHASASRRARYRIYFSNEIGTLSLALGMVVASNFANDGIVAANNSLVLRMPVFVEAPMYDDGLV